MRIHTKLYIYLYYISLYQITQAVCLSVCLCLSLIFCWFCLFFNKRLVCFLVLRVDTKKGKRDQARWCDTYAYSKYVARHRPEMLRWCQCLVWADVVKECEKPNELAWVRRNGGGAEAETKTLFELNVSARDHLVFTKVSNIKFAFIFLSV